LRYLLWLVLLLFVPLLESALELTLDLPLAPSLEELALLLEPLSELLEFDGALEFPFPPLLPLLSLMSEALSELPSDCADSGDPGEVFLLA
jgi:hypothetical protein